MNKKMTRFSCAPPGKRWLRRFLVPVSLILLMQTVGTAQNFIVNGTVNNTGSIRVKNQTVIAQPGMGGELVLTGANQTLPAKNYQHVRLNGTGIKSTAGGNLAISGNLTIAAPVTLNIQKGNILTLGDTLFEAGRLLGAIQKSVNLTGSTTSSNFGNIGATISWSSNAPGVTSVLRASDSVQIANGNQSIKRFYRVLPADTTAVGSITFQYSDAELNGHDTTIIELWQSVDNGNSWRRRPAVVDALNRTISKTNVPLAGMWAIADTTRPLGPMTAAGVPAYLTTLSAPPPERSILSVLQPFVVVITDAFGDPLKNIPVTFAVSAAPLNATGQGVSTSSTVTDSLGRAETQLTLGNKVGIYSVSVQSPTLNPITLTAKATHGAPSVLAMAGGDNQSDTVYTTIDAPVTVTVTDVGGNPVDSTMVLFAVTGSPQNASGFGISNDSVMTDSNGVASTSITLGNKPGLYAVTASSPLLPSVVFSVTAVRNAPATIAAVSGNNQSDTILTSIPLPLTVAVKDIRGNPVDSAVVQFALTSVPDNATGYSISAPAGVTDTNGIVEVSLTLGDKIGTYQVTATSAVGSLPVSIFTLNALRGAASAMQIVAGSNQNGVVGSELSQPFTISVVDAGGNPADGDTVEFSIVSTPDSAAQHRLSIGTTTTDISGLASTKLTLGTKAGSYVVGARSPKLAGGLFFASTAIPGAPKLMTASSGSGQSSQILTTIPGDIVVSILDSLGNGIPNRTVNFAVTSAPVQAEGQNVTVQSATTNAAGAAVTRLRFGNKTGEYRITATSADLPPVSVSAYATPGAANALIAARGQQQSKQIYTQLDTPMVVNVHDIGSNNVPGTMVAFRIISVPAGADGFVLTDSMVTSDSNGVARTYLTLGSKVGTYEVLAQVITPSAQPKQSDVTRFSPKRSVVETAPIETRFLANATHGAASMLSMAMGNGQVHPTESILDTALVVQVYDRGQNPVPNTPVRFAIDSMPAEAQGQTIRDSLLLTDSSGMVATQFKLGDRAGRYTVAARVDGVPVMQFHATAYVLFGDLNKDIAINVADITSYIDYILGAANLTVADSIKADVNADGRIDLADITQLRESILNTPLPDIFMEDEQQEGQPRIDLVLKKQQKKQNKSILYQHATARLEATSLGLRLNLENEVPVRGVEMRIRLKDTLGTAVGVNLQFTRAKDLSIFVRTDSNEVRLVAFDEKNKGIEAGQGPIFRLSNIFNDEQIDTAQFILSVESNLAVQTGYSKITAPQGQYPLRFSLKQNYPNPFNGSTTIVYDIPDGRRLIKSLVQVYNVLGQKVKTLVSREHDPGTYTIQWDGTDDAGVPVSSGVYFYRLMSKEFSTAKKMIYVK